MTSPHSPTHYFKKLLVQYARLPMPKKLNFLWTFGAILCVIIVGMFLSGLSLALTYTPDATLAFSSLEDVERNIPNGWLIRSIHLTGASFLFFFLYLHIFRGLFYRCYYPPQKPLWLGGCTLFCVFSLIAISGYILPFNQMSYWASSITGNILKTVPLIGPYLQNIFLGGQQPGTPTLHRMFVLHFTLAFLVIMGIILHIKMRHQTLGPPLKSFTSSKDGNIPFHPFYTSKDFLAILIALFLFTIVMCFFPHLSMERGFFRPANPLHTPPNIMPPWYLLVPFSMMQAIPSKLGGLLCAGGSVIALFCVPWLDRQSQDFTNNKQRYCHYFCCTIMVISAVIIACGGYHHMKGSWLNIVRLAMIVFYSYFILYLPLSPYCFAGDRDT